MNLASKVLTKFYYTGLVLSLDLDLQIINMLINFHEHGIQKFGIFCVRKILINVTPFSSFFAPNDTCTCRILTTNHQNKRLSILQNHRVKKVASRMFTRFSYNSSSWRSFWPTMIHLSREQGYHQSKHSYQFLDCQDFIK